MAKRPGAQEGLLFGKSAATSDSLAASQGYQVSALVPNEPAEQMKSLRIRECIAEASCTRCEVPHLCPLKLDRVSVCREGPRTESQTVVWVSPLMEVPSGGWLLQMFLI